jgi:hypothetical protein
MKMKIVAGRGHQNPCVICESLWTLTEIIEPGSPRRGYLGFFFTGPSARTTQMAGPDGSGKLWICLFIT